MQLEFRSHTTLGMIAVFTRIVIREALQSGSELLATSHINSHNSEKYEIFSGFHNFQGGLILGGTSLICDHLFEPAQTDCFELYIPDSEEDCVHCKERHSGTIFYQDDLGRHFQIMALLTTDIPSHLAIFPSRELDIHAVASCLSFQKPQWHTLPMFRERRTLAIADDMPAEVPAETETVVAGLSFPSHVFLFDDGEQDEEEDEDIIIRKGKEVEVDIKFLLDELKDSYRDNVTISWLANDSAVRPAWESVSRRIQTSEYNHLCRENSSFLRDLAGDFFVSLPVVEDIALRWAEDPADFETEKSKITSQDKDLILLQLYELNFWLSKNKSISICVTLQLVENARLLMEVFKTACKAPEAQKYKAASTRRDWEVVYNEPIDRIFFTLQETDESNIAYDEVFDIIFLRDRLQSRGMKIYLSGSKKSSIKNSSSMKEEEEPCREHLIDDPDAPNYSKRSIRSGMSRFPERSSSHNHFHDVELVSKDVAYCLCFRAELVGVLLALGTDNSDVLRLQTMNQIVPFM